MLINLEKFFSNLRIPNIAKKWWPPIVAVLMTILVSPKPTFFGSPYAVDGPYYTTFMQYGGDVLNHFPGEHYYPWTRISVIFPGWVLNNLTSEYTAYITYRACLLLLFSLSIFMITRTMVKNVSSLFILWFVISSPSLLIIMSNEYHFFFILPVYLTFVNLMIYSFLISKKRSATVLVISGTLLALMVTSAASIPVLIVAWTCVQLLCLFWFKSYSVKEQVIRNLHLFLGFLIGLFLVFLQGLAIYRDPTVLRQALSWSIEIATSGMMTYWRSSSLSWIAPTTTLLLIVVATSILILKSANRRFAEIDVKAIVSLGVIMASMVLYYSFSQFVWSTGMGLFEMTHHLSLIIMIAVMIISIFIGKAFDQLNIGVFALVAFSIVSFYGYRLEIDYWEITPKIFFIAVLIPILVCFMFSSFMKSKNNRLIKGVVSVLLLSGLIQTGLTLVYMGQTVGPIPNTAGLRNLSFRDGFDPQVEWGYRYAVANDAQSWIWANLAEGEVITWLSPGHAWSENDFVFEFGSRFIYWAPRFTVTDSGNELAESDYAKFESQMPKNLLIIGKDQNEVKNQIYDAELRLNVVSYECKSFGDTNKETLYTCVLKL